MDIKQKQDIDSLRPITQQEELEMQKIRTAVNTLFDAVVERIIDDKSALNEFYRIKASVQGKPSRFHGEFNYAVKTYPKFIEVVKLLAPAMNANRNTGNV